MKKSKTETAATRKRIVEVAAGTFKTHGIHATGVAEIMAAAGLTHGGFYRHFESKEQLVAEACAASMADLIELAEASAQGGDESLVKYIENFLSTEFRDNCAGGCPLVTMGSELARADMDSRRAASEGIRKMAEIIAGHSQLGDSAAARAEAVFMVAAMVGAVTVSRIVDDPAFSAQILEIARKRLAGPGAKINAQKKKRARAKAV